MSLTFKWAGNLSFHSGWFLIVFILTTKPDFLCVRPTCPVSVTSDGNRQHADSIPASNDTLWQGVRFESWETPGMWGWMGSTVLTHLVTLLVTTAAGATGRRWRWRQINDKRSFALFALGESREDKLGSLGHPITNFPFRLALFNFSFPVVQKHVLRSAMVERRHFTNTKNFQDDWRNCLFVWRWRSTVYFWR